MRILYFSWGEGNKKTAIDSMKELGYDVCELSIPFKSYDFDSEFMESLDSSITEREEKTEPFFAVFSFNYLPDVSRVCENRGLKYISWVYDSPHLTLQSKTLSNGCNEVYLFDYALYEKYSNEGIKTVRYLPLPARIIEYNEESSQNRYEHEITFLGNFYDGESDQYGQITTLPEYLAGYLEAIISAQEKVFGMDLISEIIDSKMYESIKEYVNAELGDNYRKCGRDIFTDIMRKRVTMNERIHVMICLGERYPVDLYSGSEHPNLPVRYLGIAENNKEMPEIFYRTKINLNITLRSIQTGIPLRVMDILGAGGFCITNYQAEIAEYFENGVDLVWYEDMNDLVQKVDYYLMHDEEREAIARRGHEKAKELFSYERQLKRIFATENE